MQIYQIKMFMWVVVCPMVDVGNVHTAVHLPSGGCWECSYIGPFAQQLVLGMFIQWSVCPAVGVGNVHTAVHLPSGKFQSAPYSLSMMSSIVGPVGEAHRSGPLRIILPMEVVTVST